MSAIRFQKCASCAHQWALARAGCPSCGGRELLVQESAGRGRVYSVTIQHRAPHKDFPEAPPWRIALIDLDEGPRIMGHLEDDGRIGARVQGHMKPFGGAMVPSFNSKPKE